MSIKQKIKIKTITGSGSFDVREERLKDSTDLIENVEVTTITLIIVLMSILNSVPSLIFIINLVF